MLFSVSNEKINATKMYSSIANGVSNDNGSINVTNMEGLTKRHEDVGSLKDLLTSETRREETQLESKGQHLNSLWR